MCQTPTRSPRGGRGYRQLMLDAASEYDFGDAYERDLMNVEVLD